MNKEKPKIGDQMVISRSKFQTLFDALKRSGYRIIGPTLCEQAIVCSDLESCDDLPIGWTDRRGAGEYRLEKRKDEALFGYTVGPHSPKKYLYPPIHHFWKVSKTKNGFELVDDKTAPEPVALIGVRACELSAIGILDKVLKKGDFKDTQYVDQRGKCFIVAVNCGQSGGTCFCASMGTGPKVEKGFDLSLTEMIEGDKHFFLVQVGSKAGAKVMEEVSYREAKQQEIKAAEEVVQKTAADMGRTLNTKNLKQILQSCPDNAHWDKVARRCLSCANCTMVCPTCFCTTVQDVTDLTGSSAERVRKWDSCFTGDFAYIHGGSVRYSTKARYRQWMTHKLANWVDQFGSFGCVGCGRCITWCPVGIDITEEAQAIRASEESRTAPGDKANKGEKHAVT